MKILAFGASNSSTSINKAFATWAAGEFDSDEVHIADLNDFEMPIYGMDKEKKDGVPGEAHAFAKLISESDLIIISFAEHNGAYSVAFKNLFDWLSRIPEQSAFQEKPMFLLATSPGARGGMTVLQIATDRLPRNGGNVLASFSLPKFGESFNTDQGIIDAELRSAFDEKRNTVLNFFKK